MNKTDTTWTQATTNPSEIMLGLVSCLESGKNAWIEIRKNGDQAYPVMKKNPALENPFNWEMNYGGPRNEQQLKNYDFFNETEKDLTYNWISCFGTKEAVDPYQANGTVMEGLVLGGNIACPVRIEDANAYRRDIAGDNYKYGFWTTYWKPKKELERWIINKDIDDVFVVCYDDEPVNRQTALVKAAQFMLEYAKKTENAGGMKNGGL